MNNDHTSEPNVKKTMYAFYFSATQLRVQDRINRKNSVNNSRSSFCFHANFIKGKQYTEALMIKEDGVVPPPSPHWDSVLVAIAPFEYIENFGPIYSADGEYQTIIFRDNSMCKFIDDEQKLKNLKKDLGDAVEDERFEDAHRIKMEIDAIERAVKQA